MSVDIRDLYKLNNYETTRRLHSEWGKFRENVIKNEGHSEEEPIMKLVDRLTENIIPYPLKKDTVVYRARLVETDKVQSMEEKYMQEVMGRVLTGKSDINQNKSIGVDVENETDAFWGYNEEESDAPPENVVGAGRINPKGVSYFYGALEPDTAISELRPQRRRCVSIAFTEIKKDLKLFDMREDKRCFLENQEQEVNEILLRGIAIDFSSRIDEDSREYIPTQCVSTYIKEKGFDGIIFSSSLNRDGTNIVLFEPRKGNYKIFKSMVREVTDVCILYSPIA